jgi:hypothetical protein
MRDAGTVICLKDNAGKLAQISTFQSTVHIEVLFSI